MLGEPGRGRVVGVHRKALYLDLPGGLCALTSAVAPPGPLHLRYRALPPARVGEQVRTDGRVLRADTWAVATDAVSWVGALPPAAVLGDVPTPADVADAAGRLGGRGPGLTPEGDDVLAGLLLVARAGGGTAVEDDLVAVARAVPTTAVASAFLLWAARGQCIAPAHDALGHLVGSAPDPGAPARLTAVGASSGAALLAGLRLGLDPGSCSTAVRAIEFDRLSP